ncbi:MAG: aminoglycoside phosphotransferase family protein [Chloroflexota bacterium]
MEIVSSSFRQRMLALHGSKGKVWLEQLPALLDSLCRRWSLAIEQPLRDLSYNFVAQARRPDGTPVMLKVGVPNDELLSEIAALRHYDGRGCVMLLEADAELGAMLLERLEPGTMLVALDDDRATRIAAEVMQTLWRPLPEAHSFVTTETWARGIARLRAAFDGGSGPFPPQLVDAAERLFPDLLASAEEPVLLHGDLHHYNILAAQRQPWLVIDPKGVSGEPLYETGALLRNPMPQVGAWPDLRRRLARRVDILAEHLQGDRARIVAWGLAQAVLSSWWNYEDEGKHGEEALIVAEALWAMHKGV